MNISLNKEKTFVESIWKREIISALIGASIVFFLIISFYLYNGLIKYKDVKCTK